MSRKGNVTQRKFAGIVVAKELAKELLENADSLGLVSLFVQGNGHPFESLQEMAEHVQSEYPAYTRYNSSIMVSGLSLALKEKMGDVAYFEVARKKKENRAMDLVEMLLKRKERMGVLEMSYDERVRTGKIGGDKSAREKLGAHAKTGEERRTMFRKMVEKRGQTPFNGDRRDTELGEQMTAKEYILALKATGNYDYRDGWEVVYLKLQMNGYPVGANRTRYIPNLRAYYFKWAKEAKKADTEVSAKTSVPSLCVIKAEGSIQLKEAAVSP